MSKQKEAQGTGRGAWRVALIAGALLAALLLVAGCGQQAPMPLTEDRFTALAREMERIEGLSVTGLREERDALASAAADASDAGTAGRAYFFRGYVGEALATKLAETGEKDETVSYTLAVQNYEKARKTSYEMQALYRIGVLGSLDKLGTHEDSVKVGKKALNSLRSAYEPDKSFFAGFGQRTPVKIWLRGTFTEDRKGVNPSVAGEGGPASPVNLTATGTSGNVMVIGAAPVASMRLLDIYNQDPAAGLDHMYYVSVDWFFGLMKGTGLDTAGAVVLGLILLALVVKLVTLPFTNMSYKGMREMQRVQPLIAELKAKYGDNQQKLYEEQAKLMKEHKINPLGGCLPMLVQIPFFIVVYQAVLVYSSHFDVPFMWVKSLATPDQPLLIMYLLSMLVTQWLTAQPSTDPQQKMMQMWMTVVLPVMLAAVLSTVPSAFILYWFALNVVSSAHQYYLKVKLGKEESAKPELTAGPVTDATPKKRKRRL